MLSREENETLTRTGPGTPMGELIRRHWIPALLSTELPDADGEPRRIRLLSEDLIAVRATNGRVGIMAEHCPHRGASLAYARSEGCALRCIYHGWKVDLDGNILETPSEPGDSEFKNRIKHVAYPTHEVAGLVWVYMGPPERQPSFPHWEWTLAPAENLDLSKVFQDCNYAQGVEGSIDSAHSDYLHSSDIRGRPKDHAPRLETQDTPYGFRYAAIRKPDEDADRLKYVRVTLFAAPFYVFIPPQRAGKSTRTKGSDEVVVQQAWVPIDDEHNYFYTLRYNRRGPIDHEHDKQFQKDEQLRPRRNRANMHLQDRAAMRAGNWTGIEGINSQDFAVAESMGPIYDRTREHLGKSDVAVIRYRRRMIEAARALAAGAEPPLGLDPSIAHVTLCTDEQIVPIDTSWQTVADTAAERLTVPAVVGDYLPTRRTGTPAGV